MSNHISHLSSFTAEEARHESKRSLFDRIFLGVLIWAIPLILASLILSGSIRPAREVSSAEDTFVYGIKKQLYIKK
jgi:hypothetical protein